MTFDGAGNAIDGDAVGIDYGVFVNSSTALTNVTVENLVATDWYYGIYYRNASNGSIENSTANSNGGGDGINLASSSFNSVEGNDATNNGDSGIKLDASGCPCSSNNITRSNASNNTYGIYLIDEDNVIIKDNYVLSNQYGIYLQDFGNAVDNLIYNNYVAGNTNGNAVDERGGSNSWNTTKKAGTNIIGDPFIGGNFWGDYTGVDVDGDTIGDTLLPYDITDGFGGIGGRDFLPLTLQTQIIIPPILVLPIANTTNGSGIIELADQGVPQAFIQQTGVTGYEYLVTTNGTIPVINLSVNVSIEPPTGVSDIANESGAISGFYYTISVNDSAWFANVTTIQLRIYYNRSLIDLPSGVDESSLRPVRFTNGSWVRLDCDALGGCTATLADDTKLFAADVVTSAENSTHPYVWANLSNFSVYGMSGTITPAAAAPSPAGTYKPQAVVLANSIDRALASDLYGFLRNQGIEIIEATAANFDSYKSSARFIIILGGPDAPEGIGAIVKSILSKVKRKFPPHLQQQEDVREDQRIQARPGGAHHSRKR